MNVIDLTAIPVIKDLQRELAELTKKVAALEAGAGPQWLTVAQAAELSGVCPATIHRRIQRGEIAIKPGNGRRMIHRDAIQPRQRKG